MSKVADAFRRPSELIETPVSQWNQLRKSYTNYLLQDLSIQRTYKNTPD